MRTTDRSRFNIWHHCVGNVRDFCWSQVLFCLDFILLLLLRRRSNFICLVLNILLRRLLLLFLMLHVITGCDMSILVIHNLLIIRRVILMMIFRNQRCSFLTINKCQLPAHPTGRLPQPTIARLEIIQGLHFICSQIILNLILRQHFILFQKSLVLQCRINDRYLLIIRQTFILLYKLMESSLDWVQLVPENTLGVTHPVRLHCLLQFPTIVRLLPPMERRLGGVVLCTNLLHRQLWLVSTSLHLLEDVQFFLCRKLRSSLLHCRRRTLLMEIGGSISLGLLRPNNGIFTLVGREIPQLVSSNACPTLRSLKMFEAIHLLLLKEWFRIMTT
mmetsp:Transcript_16008/g.23745  ORF Transcript_16008/g.23745 Transcript_16008/m.23745 type:complete len:331 (+) Transcript_16008:103-1095(+)